MVKELEFNPRQDEHEFNKDMRMHQYRFTSVDTSILHRYNKGIIY